MKLQIKQYKKNNNKNKFFKKIIKVKVIITL